MPPPGSYRQIGIGNEERKILLKDKAFVTSLQLAKIKLLAKSIGKIIRLDKIYAQVVNGINYNFNFDTTSGLYEVKVFCQPWTKTFKVTSIIQKAKAKYFGWKYSNRITKILSVKSATQRIWSAL